MQNKLVSTYSDKLFVLVFFLSALFVVDKSSGGTAISFNFGSFFVLIRVLKIHNFPFSSDP